MRHQVNPPYITHHTSHDPSWLFWKSLSSPFCIVFFFQLKSINVLHLVYPRYQLQLRLGYVVRLGHILMSHQVHPPCSTHRKIHPACPWSQSPPSRDPPRRWPAARPQPPWSRRWTRSSPSALLSRAHFLRPSQDGRQSHAVDLRWTGMEILDK